MNALARWIKFPTETNRPLDLSSVDQDFDREEILDDLAHFTEFAARGTDVLLRTDKALGLLRPHHDAEQLIVIVYGLHGNRQLVSFWMNRSSVSGLVSAKLHADRAVDFDVLLSREEVPA